MFWIFLFSSHGTVNSGKGKSNEKKSFPGKMGGNEIIMWIIGVNWIIKRGKIWLVGFSVFFFPFHDKKNFWKGKVYKMDKDE